MFYSQIHSYDQIDINIVVVDNLFNQLLNLNDSIPDSGMGSGTGIANDRIIISNKLDFENFNFSNTMIRVYYMCTKDDTCIYKSHGDIRFE